VTVLAVDDQSVNLRLLDAVLTPRGHRVLTASSGSDGLALLETEDVDLVLLDVVMPEMDGYEVCRRIRSNESTEFLPVVMITASGSEQRLNALLAGADDFITKPFHKAEMAARINAVVRRSRGHSQSIIRTGAIALNIDTRSAEVSGVPVHLTPSEYKVLELLSLRKNTVLTKEMCLNHLYNGLNEPEVKIIDVFVCKLRKKLAHATQGASAIETVWGGGYMLRDAPAQAQIPAEEQALAA
jgi:two-component system cell cycle response regulator CtrA